MPAEGAQKLSRTSKERKYPVMAIAIIAALALTIMATASVYIKRTSDFSVSISNSANVDGVPTAGFYAGDNNNLPLAFNPNATTYGSNMVVVHYTNPVYTSIDSGGAIVKLYAGATIDVPVTNGEWVLDKVLAIGFPSDSMQGKSVQVKLVVEDASAANEATANLYYRTSDSDVYHQCGTLNLKVVGDTATINFGGIGSEGLAFYVSIDLTYAGTGNDDFSIGVYLSG